MASVFDVKATGGGAMSLSASAPVGFTRRVMGLTLHLSAAPVTAGNLTITLDAVGGGDYNTQYKSVSMVGVTDYVWLPDQELFIMGGDAVKVAYANPDGRTYGACLTLKAV